MITMNVADNFKGNFRKIYDFVEIGKCYEFDINYYGASYTIMEGKVVEKIDETNEGGDLHLMLDLPDYKLDLNVSNIENVYEY